MLADPETAILSVQVSVTRQIKASLERKREEERKERKGKGGKERVRMNHILNIPDYIFKNQTQTVFQKAIQFSKIFPLEKILD